MAINIKDELIKGGISIVATIVGGGISAVIVDAVNKRAARDDREMNLAKAKALIEKLAQVSELSTKQSNQLSRALRTVFINDVDEIKINVISKLILSNVTDKDEAICDIEHRLTVRGPVTRETLATQKKWLYHEIEGINRAYGIYVAVTTSI